MCCQKAVQTLDADICLDTCLEATLLNWKRPLDCFVIKSRKAIFSIFSFKFNNLWWYEGIVHFSTVI